MDKKTQTLIVVGLVAVGGYLWWKNRQGKNGTSSASGGGAYVQGSCHCTSCSSGQDNCYNKTGRDGGINPCGTGYVWQSGSCPASSGGSGGELAGTHGGGGYTKPRYTSRSRRG